MITDSQGDPLTRRELLRRIGRLEQVAGIEPFVFDAGPSRGVRAFRFTWLQEVKRAGTAWTSKCHSKPPDGGLSQRFAMELSHLGKLSAISNRPKTRS